MALGQGDTLSDQETRDVAAYVDSHKRPQDPWLVGQVERFFALITDEQIKPGAHMSVKAL